MSFIPKECRFIFDILESNGYECFAVGGCIRDKIRGIIPVDWDFTTNALPDEIIKCFSCYKIIDIGKTYGTVCVISDGEQYEITTYRVDGEYSDSRHPDKVSFSTSIEDDLSRRDFTMNSIAYNDKVGFVDPFGGVNDILGRVIRCTGEAEKRFDEDALRILRAIRFSAKLGFSIDKSTHNAILKKKDNLRLIHPMRVRKELSGLLTSQKPASVMDNYREVLEVIIPELSPMFGLEQNNPHHKFDVWQHTLKAIDNSLENEILRLSLLFHDIGKPLTKTTDENCIDHFKKHQTESVRIASDVLTRFGYSKDVISSVCLLIRYHDERFPNINSDIRRVLSKIGPDLFMLLIDVIYCDISAQSDYLREQKLSHLGEVEKEYRKIISVGECYSIPQLAIDGNDLISLGFKGSAIGNALNVLLDLVIKGKISNNREALLNASKYLDKQ